MSLVLALDWIDFVSQYTLSFKGRYPSQLMLPYLPQCYSGECCEKCKFTSYNKICRDASSECDLVEYCTGTSSQVTKEGLRLRINPFARADKKGVVS